MAKISFPLVKILAALSGLLQLINCEMVTIHELADFKGDNYNFTMDYRTHKSRCVNIPFKWDHKVSSINTRNLCLKLYKERNCRGDKINLYPGTNHHSNLSNWLFDDSLSSLKLCRKRADRNNAVQITTEDDKTYHLTVASCKNIPNEIQKMKNLTTHGECYKLYGGKNCKKYLGKKSSTFEEPSILKSIASMRRCRTRVNKKWSRLIPYSSKTSKNIPLENTKKTMHNYSMKDDKNKLFIVSSVELNDDDQKSLNSLFALIVSQSKSQQPISVTLYSKPIQSQSLSSESTAKSSYATRREYLKKFWRREPVDLM